MARFIPNLFKLMYVLTEFNILCTANVKIWLEKVQHGYRLDRTMIDSFTGYSIWDCMDECARTKRCKSVGYYRGGNYCEINFENRVTAPDKFIRSIGWIYSDREENWNQEPDGHCSASNCEINQKCTSIFTVITVCILSDCGFPNIPGADINSLKRWDAIGFQRRMSAQCLETGSQSGTGQLICQYNGQWKSDLDCGWLRYGNHFYKLFPTKLTFQESKIKCQEQNSYLLALETIAEYEWVKTNLIDIQTNDIWLGGTDHVTEGRWTWIHNNSPWAVTYWAAGEPNDSKGTLNCAIQKQNDGLWYDRKCGEAHAYVCEHAQSNS